MSAAGVLLTHGAGGGADHPTLMALEAGLRLPVRRIEFPYRRAGRRAPDRMPRLVETVRAEAEALAGELGVGVDRLVLGGRSMGGRAGRRPVWCCSATRCTRRASPRSCGPSTSAL